MLYSKGQDGAEGVIQAIKALDPNRLESLPAHVAVLNASGIVKLINPTWKAFAAANGGRADAYLGENYLDVCRKSASTDDDAEASFEGIKAVLDGDLPGFAREYPCHSPSVQRWFRMEVALLDLQQRSSVIVSHIDVTETKLEQITLQETVKNVQAALLKIGLIVSRPELTESLNVSKIFHATTISDALGETAIDAHYLASQMLEFVKRKDFVEKEETEFVAALINDWARSVGTGLFMGKKFFAGEAVRPEKPN
jgi:hypothetical protein